MLENIYDTTPEDLLPKIERLADMIRPAWLQTEDFHVEPQQIYRETGETIEIQNDPEGCYLVLQGVQIGFIGIYKNSPSKSRVFVELLDHAVENLLAVGLVNELSKGIRRMLTGKESRLSGLPKNRKDPGPKHNQDDVWAWEEIHIKQRDPSEVKREWIIRLESSGRKFAEGSIDRTWRKIKKYGWNLKKSD